MTSRWPKKNTASALRALSEYCQRAFVVVRINAHLLRAMSLGVAH